jgi:hypothetical protein
MEFKKPDNQNLAIIDKEAAISATFVAQLTLRNVFYMAKMQTFGADDFVFKVGSTTSRDVRVASSTYSVPDLFFQAIIVTDQFQNLGLGSRLISYRQTVS